MSFWWKWHYIFTHCVIKCNGTRQENATILGCVCRNTHEPMQKKKKGLRSSLLLWKVLLISPILKPNTEAQNNSFLETLLLLTLRELSCLRTNHSVPLSCTLLICAAKGANFKLTALNILSWVQKINMDKQEGSDLVLEVTTGLTDQGEIPTASKPKQVEVQFLTILIKAFHVPRISVPKLLLQYPPAGEGFLD